MINRSPPRSLVSLCSPDGHTETLTTCIGVDRRARRRSSLGTSKSAEQVNMRPNTTTTTTEMWQWQCGTCRSNWKMLRQVTTTCCPHGHGHGGRCFQAGQGALPPPSPYAGNPAPHCHHHHYRLQEDELQGTSSRALAAGAEGSNADAGRRHTITTTLKPAPPVAVAEACWVPDPYLMVQQLREFECLNKDELVALRVQLQEYAEEIHKSCSEEDVNWLLALPANVRDVVVLARDVIESFLAISTRH